MRKVIIFIKGKKAQVLDVEPYEQNVVYVSSQAKVKTIPIQILFAMFSNSKCGAVSFAAEHYVSSIEVINAHHQLILRGYV